MFKRLFQSTKISEEQNGCGDDIEMPQVYKTLYFYGRISRKMAEDILMQRGKREGSYLLRESITPMGNYSMSMIHNNRCVHYAIEKQIDGQFMIMDGQKFQDPVDLIQFYSSNPGFVTSPKYPCNRNSNEEAIAFRGISYNDLHNHMKLVARKMNASLLRALGPLHETLMIHVLRSMHESMPWYHGEISREEAIHRIEQSGLEDGKFIVRCRNVGESYAITMCHEGVMRHYVISVMYGETYQIDKGPNFKALIILVDHYHNKRDGLVCNLSMPCCEPNHKHAYWEKYKRLSCLYGGYDSTAAEEVTPSRKTSESGPFPPPPTRMAPPPPPPPSQVAGWRESVSFENGAVGGQVYEDLDEDEDTNDSSLGKAMSPQEAQDLEKVYIDIRTAVLSMHLEPKHVKLTSKLGSGQFGEVMKGTCMLGNTEIPVAVKTLKNQDPEGEKEIQLEANVMKNLDHQHIVRMIGVCKTESIMLVMELAELGSLKKFLQSHESSGLRQWHLLEIIMQICDGMMYLESKDVVHRDLATRNVLLLNEHFAKISDFGMSRMVDSDTEYYKAHGKGRWPLMWYAPECLYYHKFDSKSDVWSFGITMWEVMSYASRPYNKMKVPQIIHFLESGYRMAKPKNCDQKVYSVMLSCWEFTKQRRPNFKALYSDLEPIFRHFRHLDQ